MWHVCSRSGVATLRTAIQLLLTCYLLGHHSCQRRVQETESNYNSALETFVIIALYKSIFTIPYHTSVVASVVGTMQVINAASKLGQLL